MAVGCELYTTSNEIEPPPKYLGFVIPPAVDHELITDDGRVAEPLLKFLDLLNIEHEGIVESVNTAM